jgi:ribosome-associated heat shock protein Hsp15
MSSGSRVERAQSVGTDPAATQRIDKWLWFARMTKSRTLAAELVVAGRIRVNREKAEKPSQTVRPGDVLTIALGARARVLKVVATGVRRGPASEAAMLYDDLTPPPPPADVKTALAASREPGAGRPTKRDRRAIDRFTGGGD